MELRTLSFLGPDSVTAGRAVAAAAQQNKAWTFADILYFNQGEENKGWVTPALLSKAYKAAGVDAAKATAYAQEPRLAGRARRGQLRWPSQLGVDSTPTILVRQARRRRGEDQRRPGRHRGLREAAIDALLGGPGRERQAPAHRRDRPVGRRARRRRLPDLHPLRGHQARLRASRTTARRSRPPSGPSSPASRSPSSA